MTVFGKVLIVVNLLVTAVFVYVASIDWAKRATWSYAVYRDELRINGLPVDEFERDPIAGVLLIDRLSDNTLKQIFQHAPGGNPVTTQSAEVKQVRDEVGAAIAALPDEPAKRARLKELLLPL